MYHGYTSNPLLLLDRAIHQNQLCKVPHVPLQKIINVRIFFFWKKNNLAHSLEEEGEGEKGPLMIILTARYRERRTRRFIRPSMLGSAGSSSRVRRFLGSSEAAWLIRYATSWVLDRNSQWSTALFWGMGIDGSTCVHSSIELVVDD